jgi:hypothetical protein
MKIKVVIHLMQTIPYSSTKPILLKQKRYQFNENIFPPEFQKELFKIEIDNLIICTASKAISFR